MGRERQKQKRKSSFPKVRMKSKSKKLNIKGSQIVAANWDRSKSLDQNYRRLGLTSRLKGPSGGVEKSSAESQASTHSATGGGDSLRLPVVAASTPSEARIERDPETGAILHLVMPETDSAHNPLDDPLNDLSDAECEEDRSARASTGIVKELEVEASRPSRRRTHPASLWEAEWVERLVAKYGADYGRMARDRKLNPYQRTETDIRKRVERHDLSRPPD